MNFLVYSKLTTTTMSKEAKALAEKAYKAFNERDFEQFKTIFSQDYCSNRIGFAKKVGYEESVNQGHLVFFNAVPAKFEVIRMIADDDFVWVQSKITGFPDNSEVMSVDIFKYANNQFVEHWDIQQGVPQ